MNEEVTSVLLIDDDATFLRHAARFLGRERAIRIVGLATGASEGIREAAELQPDVILLDLSMPDVDGLEALPLLAAAAPGARIVAVTSHEADPYRELAMMGGAHGFVPKSRLVDDLIPELFRPDSRPRT